MLFSTEIEIGEKIPLKNKYSVLESS
jgi:hypothetical protein